MTPSLITKGRKATHARVDLIAYELGLSRSEIEKAKSSDDVLIDFAYRHHLSFDKLSRPTGRGIGASLSNERCALAVLISCLGAFRTPAA